MMPNSFNRFTQVSLLAALLILVGCGSASRYKLKDDVAPTNAPDVSKVENAHAKYEPYSRGGNRNYTVRGKSYRVLKTGKGYKATGLASWYGAKFHGHLTSNGEIYDMYSMSAAHKTLPLPSYVKVTNLANQKQVIVRVNDRGPFHGKRILDLSYAAAHRLGMIKTGTAKITMEVIYFPSPTEQALQTNTNHHYIQVLASSNPAKVEKLSKRLKAEKQFSSRILSSKKLHKLQLGPFTTPALAQSVLEQMKQQGFPQSFMIQEISPVQTKTNP